VLVVGIDLGTQSLKAVVCNDRLDVLGSHAVAYATRYPQPGWAEQDPRVWEAALAPAVQGALVAAGVQGRDLQAIAVSGQLDGCVAVDADGAPLHGALIWQDRRAIAEQLHAPAHRVFEIAGQVADASHMAPKIRWLRGQGVRAARYHQPVTYLVERLCGASVIDPALASTTMLYDVVGGRWSRELLSAFSIDPSELPALQAAHSIAGTLTASGAALLGLPVGVPVAVGTGDDFATSLGAGIAEPGPIAVALGTAEVVGALADAPVFDVAAARSTGNAGACGHDPWHALPEPMVETHAYPTGAFFIENPGWMSGGAVRWAQRLLGAASDAELDALAASAPPGADGVTFIPALAGAMTPVWRSHARGTLHGLTPSHDRGHLARALLEGLAFACRDVVQRLVALGLPAREVYVLGGGGRSALWMQIRADALGLPHRASTQTDTCPIGAAMLALVALGGFPDVKTAATHAPPLARPVQPGASLDEAYSRYRRLVEQLAPVSGEPW